MASTRPRTVPTGPALALAGIDRNEWLKTSGRGLFSTQPQGSRGVHRRFTLEHVIAAKTYDALIKHLCLHRRVAAAISDSVFLAMQRHPEAETLALVSGPPGFTVAPLPQDESAVLMRFSVARYRASYEAAFAKLAS